MRTVNSTNTRCIRRIASRRQFPSIYGAKLLATLNNHQFANGGGQRSTPFRDQPLVALLVVGSSLSGVCGPSLTIISSMELSTVIMLHAKLCTLLDFERRTCRNNFSWFPRPCKFVSGYVAWRSSSKNIKFYVLLGGC